MGRSLGGATSRYLRSLSVKPPTLVLRTAQRETHASLCRLVENFQSNCFMGSCISHSIISIKIVQNLRCLVLFIGISNHLHVILICFQCLKCLSSQFIFFINFAYCVFGWFYSQWSHKLFLTTLLGKLFQYENLR